MLSVLSSVTCKKNLCNLAPTPENWQQGGISSGPVEKAKKLGHEHGSGEAIKRDGKTHHGFKASE